MQLQRVEEASTARATYATLVVGSTQDDTLLLAQPLVLERVASPWVKTVVVQRVANAQQPCTVVASVIMDRCVERAGEHTTECTVTIAAGWLAAT